MFRLATVAILVFAISVFAGPDDPIQKKLDEANTAYEAMIKKAEGDLASAFDEKAETARKAGNFEAVKRAKTEKDAFEKDGTVPKLTNMKIAFTNYLRAVKQANLEIEGAYKKAVQDYTKANQLDKAEATNAGLAELKKRSKKQAAGSAAPIGKTTWLADLTAHDVKVAEGRFGQNGNLGYSAGNSQRIRFQGKESPHGISTCPVQGDCAIAKFSLPNDAATFVTSAALNDSAGASGAPAGVGRIGFANHLPGARRRKGPLGIQASRYRQKSSGVQSRCFRCEGARAEG